MSLGSVPYFYCLCDAQHLVQASQTPIMGSKALVWRKRLMDAEQIEAIKDMLEKAYPWESSVTGYKYDPQYCG